MIKKLLLIFLTAFGLNFLWESLHSHLYVHYQGSAITQMILLRAALVDATFITALAILFIKIGYFRRRKWWALVIGFVAAALLERFALAHGRWAYNDLMPIIPLLRTGLTPTIQLGLISYCIFRWTGLIDHGEH